MKKSTVRLMLLLLIIAAGTLVRLWGIAQGGFAFTYDTGRDLLAVRDLVNGTKFSLIGPTSGQMGVFYGPWYYWFLAIPFALSGGNPTVIVSFIALLGVVASAVAFWWGRRFHGDTFAIVFSGLLALSPVFIGATTQLWSPDLIIPTMIAILVLWSRIGRIGWKGLIGLGFLVGLLDEWEIVYGAIFSVGFLLALLVWQRKTLLSKKGLLVIVGMLSTEIPRVFFELRHQFLQTNALLSFAGGSGLGWSRLRPHFVWEQVIAILPEWPGLLRLVCVVLVGIAVALQMGKMEKRRRIFLAELLTVFGTFILFAVFYGRDVWPYYLIGLPVISAIFIAMAFTQFRKVLTPAIAAVVIGMFLFFVAKPVEFIVTAINPPFVGDAAVFRNQKEAIQYIYAQSQGKNFNLIAYTPPQIEYTWRYLSWWTKRDRPYGEVREKQEQLFVIVEPDYGYPERVRNWLWSRKDDGEITKQIMFNSGIMVQTRKRDIRQ